VNPRGYRPVWGMVGERNSPRAGQFAAFAASLAAGRENIAR
jgi:hypothetical protein